MTAKEQTELERYFSERWKDSKSLRDLESKRKSLEPSVVKIKGFKSEDYSRLYSFTYSHAKASASVVSVGITGVSASLNLVSAKIRGNSNSVELRKDTRVGKDHMVTNNATWLQALESLAASAVFPVWLLVKWIVKVKTKSVKSVFELCDQKTSSTGK